MLFCRDNDGNVYLSVGLKFETAKENLIVVEGGREKLLDNK